MEKYVRKTDRDKRGHLLRFQRASPQAISSEECHRKFASQALAKKSK